MNVADELAARWHRRLIRKGYRSVTPIAERNCDVALVVLALHAQEDAMKMNPVVHFEMPAVDRKRMASFYGKAFGWQTQMLGSDMGDYVVVTTTESDDGGPKNPGAINGGFYTKSNDKPAQYPAVVISVDDIEVAIKKVSDAGGKVLGDPMEIPGVGKYVSFYDTEGNRASILQPLPRMDVRPKSR
jgi:uncharacterized protein